MTSLGKKEKSLMLELPYCEQDSEVLFYKANGLLETNIELTEAALYYYVIASKQFSDEFAYKSAVEAAKIYHELKILDKADYFNKKAKEIARKLENTDDTHDLEKYIVNSKEKMNSDQLSKSVKKFHLK